MRQTGLAENSLTHRNVRSAVRLAAAALASILVSTACGGADGQSTATSEGQALYEANCASCHGTDLRGTDKGPSHLSVFYEPGHHNDDAFRSAIANGSPAHHWNFGDMPPVPGLSPTEVDEIISYVREVQQEQGFER